MRIRTDKLIQSEIFHHMFHYHLNRTLKVMTKFVTELVEKKHFFGIDHQFQCSRHAELKDSNFCLTTK